MSASRITVRHLAARGFGRNPNIPGFVGHCSVCNLYRPCDWWESPDDEHGIRGNVVVCTYCGHIDGRDESYVMRFPVVRKKETGRAPVGETVRANVA